MLSTQVKSSTKIHSVDADPYKVLAAALLQYTIYDAVDFTPRHGQSQALRDRRRFEAQRFFTSSLCHGWLELVRPEDITIEDMQQMFVDQINDELARFRKRPIRIDLDGTLGLEGSLDGKARSAFPEESYEETSGALS